MCCMAMCNLILSTVLQVADSYITEEEESHFMLQCREFAIRWAPCVALGESSCGTLSHLHGSLQHCVRGAAILSGVLSTRHVRQSQSGSDKPYCCRYRRGDRPPAPPRSFRRLWDLRCASAWRVTLVLFAAGAGPMLPLQPDK